MKRREHLELTSTATLVSLCLGMAADLTEIGITGLAEISEELRRRNEQNLFVFMC